MTKTYLEQKEIVYNEIYDRLVWNPDPKKMERSKIELALYVVDQIMNTQVHIKDGYMELAFATYWTSVRQEIEKDLLAWKD